MGSTRETPGPAVRRRRAGRIAAAGNPAAAPPGKYYIHDNIAVCLRAYSSRRPARIRFKRTD
jgi:hypothetical protein